MGTGSRTPRTSTRTTAAIARTHTVAIAGTSQRFFFFAAGGPGCAATGGGDIEGGGPTGATAVEVGTGAGEGVALSAAFTRVPQWGQKALSPTSFPQFVQNIATSLSLIHISEPTRLGMISYAVFCLKK